MNRKKFDVGFVFAFAAFFIIFLLFLPVPYFYELCSCPLSVESISDCACATESGLFFGIHYLYENFIQEASFNYFKEYRMSLFYIPVWYVLSFVFAFIVVFVYWTAKSARIEHIPIITNKRKNALDTFTKKTLDVLTKLSKTSKEKAAKDAFRNMKKEITRSPLFIYDRKAMRIGVASHDFSDHVVEYYFVRKGSAKGRIPKRFITLPAWRFFLGEEITKEGVFALWREWAYFKSSSLSSFLTSKGIKEGELSVAAVDILTLIAAKEFGYSPRDIEEKMVSDLSFAKVLEIANNLLA